MAAEQDPKLQAFQLKEIQNELAGVEQRMQRLAILKKSIELQLIDPKDEQRFNTFLKKLSNVDVSNIESLRRFISGANDQFDELIRNNQNFATQTDDNLKTFISLNSQLAKFATRFSGANKTIKDTAKEVSELNSELEESNELADTFLKSFEEEYKKWNDLDKVQSEIIDNLKNMNSEQIDNIKNAFGLNSTYGEVSANIAEITSKLQNSKTNVSNMFQFDYGMIEGFVQNADAALSGIGQDVEIEIEGKQIKGDELFQYLRNLGDNIGPMISQSLEGHISTAKKVLVSELNETSDVIDAMIADLSAKLANPNAQILSPDMQGKVEAAWKKANDGIKDTIGNIVTATISMNGLNDNINHINSELDIFSAKTEQISKSMEPVNRYMEVQLNQLEYMTRNLMPNWLYQTLGLDSAFQDISKNMSEGLSNVAKNIAAGQSPMQALSGFAGSFTASLVKSIGVIGLITIGLTALWNMMTAAGESVKELSKEFGVSRNTAHGMYKDILNITAAVGNTSIKQEDVLEVLKKHRDQYGLIMDLNNKANQESVKFAAELGKQYGIGAGEAYAFTEQLQQLGADKAASEEIAAVAAHASNLAGIPFSTITKDLAESSEFVATQFAGMPQKAVATTAKLRAMGSSLKQVEKSMEKAFDTSNFLKGMTELNIMTRGVVDLSAMFQKSMSGDVEGTAKEVAKQFDKMVASGQTNMFQMRQFAQVTGVSVEELQKGNKIRQRSAELGEDNVELLSKYLDKLSDADVADAKSAMKAAKRLSAAEKLDTIWASIKDTLTEALLPVLDTISDLIVSIAPVLKIIGIIFKAIGVVVKGLAAPFALVYDIFSGIVDLATGSTPKFERIKSLFGDWSSILGGVANVIGIIIAGFTSVKIIGAISKWAGGIEGLREKLKGMGGGIEGLGPKFMSAFSGFKGGEGIMGKLKGGVKGLFGKTPDATTPEVPAAPGQNKSLLGKGMDKVKGFFGFGNAQSGDALQAPANELTEAANELKAAADALRNSGSSSFDRSGKGRRGGRRAAGRRTRTPKVNTPANQVSPKTTTSRYRDPKTGRFAKAPSVPEVKTPAAGTTSKAGGMIDKIKTGGKGLLKPTNLMKGLGIGALTAVAGAGLDYVGSKYEEEAMQTGDQSAMNKSRALSAGGAALEGAGIGAMIGSIVPGIGTAVGGAVGGVIGGAVGIWKNYFSDDAKKQDEQLKQIREGNKIANGLNDLTEAEMQQLKEAGYSDDVIKKISEGNLSLEGAIKEQFSELNLNEDQLKKLADPKTTAQERDAIMESATPADKSSSWLGSAMSTIGDSLGSMLIPGYSAAKTVSSLAVGTNLVKSDGMAMLHQGEAVVPADVVKGGFNMSGGSVPIPLPVTITNPSEIKGPENVGSGFIDKLSNMMGLEAKIPEPQTSQKAIEPASQKVAPVNNEIAPLETPVTQPSGTGMDSGMSAIPGKSSGNQDALLKQLMTIMQDVANRPVQVEIGGVELRSINRKMKTYNNKN